MGVRVDSGDDPEDELAAAIGLFVLGELSLGKAAERADVSRWEMESILDTAGVERRYGPRSADELDAEIRAALDRE